MAKISDRFVEFFEYQGVTAHEFERKIGLSNGLIGKIKKTSSSFGVDVLEKLLNIYPEINCDWLLRGVGEMFISTNGQNNSIKNYINDNFVSNFGSNPEDNLPMTPAEKKRLEQLEQEMLAQKELVAQLVKSQATLIDMVGKSGTELRFAPEPKK